MKIGVSLMENRICPICRQEVADTVCGGCGNDLEEFDRLNQTVRDLLNQAMESMRIKSYVTALAHLKKALELNQQDSAVLLMAGLCHYALGDLHQAELCWQKSQNSLALEYRQKTSVEQEEFKQVAGSYNHALDLMEKARYKQAIRVLRRALKAGPQYLPALELLVLAYYQQKKYQRCWRAINRIRKVTVDAPILVQIVPDLMQKVSKLRLAYGVVLFFVAFVVFGYLNRQITAMEIKPVVKEVAIERPSTAIEIDRQLLQDTASRLARQGDYLTAADILLALHTQHDRSLTLTPAENLIFEKAAASYYFKGRRNLRKGRYSEAAMDFSLSLRYPVHSYVYDDTLYYQACVRERLGLPDRAVVLYRRLLEEVPDSCYCQSAVIRWSRLADTHIELQKEFIALIKEYPDYAEPVQHRLAKWEEKQ